MLYLDGILETLDSKIKMKAKQKVASSALFKKNCKKINRIGISIRSEGNYYDFDDLKKH